MGTRYHQLSLKERCTIAGLHETGHSIRQIAAAMDRTPSTVARELKRNTSHTQGYAPEYAHLHTASRRWRGSRLERQPGLQQDVLSRLARGWSPAPVAGRLAHEQGTPIISHESTYRFLYAQIRRTKNYAWRHYLPRAKCKRGYRRRQGSSPVHFIRDRVSIHARPQAANTRTQPGHWEADLMLFAKYGQAVLVAHERRSRLLVVTRQPNKTSTAVARQLRRLLSPLPEPLRQTMTFDNGTEFAQHYRLPLRTFFCDPHAPWQKGGVENAIGRLRRSLPRKTDLATLSHQDLRRLTRRYNQTPRQCLDFRTPAEVFSQYVLHFKCESTFPPSWE